ncbi:MAG: DUF4864 domain-containing protein [Oscillatoriales cyanobacterium RM2_1_1]|nr:DUF4864 domain-containing protein [Oscillatoriales cyanobacterium SM2_3_0]NJO44482.1 DUF4864 domain-containing protein [Oscillatoriales cyanobacterium RM2_1_1]
MITDRDRQVIRLIVERQLLAFQQNDDQSAFSLASPNIRKKFVTAESFVYMVKRNYPAVYRPRGVIFEELDLSQEVPTQPVLLLSPNGALVRAIYVMEQQADYNWRINGCYLMSLNERIN